MTATIKWLGGTVAALVAGIALAGGAAHADTLRWTGNVDDTAYIRLDGRNVRTDANMQGVRDTRFDIDGRLPNRSTRVRLVNQRGARQCRDRGSNRAHGTTTPRSSVCATCRTAVAAMGLNCNGTTRAQTATMTATTAATPTAMIAATRTTGATVTTGATTATVGVTDAARSR